MRSGNDGANSVLTKQKDKIEHFDQTGKKYYELIYTADEPITKPTLSGWMDPYNASRTTEYGSPQAVCNAIQQIQNITWMTPLVFVPSNNYFRDSLTGAYGHCDNQQYTTLGWAYRFFRCPDHYYLYNPIGYGSWAALGDNVYGTSDNMCYNTDQATILQYVTDKCPVDEPRELNKIPGYDALTQQLEDGVVLTSRLTPDTQAALSCWKTKVESLGIPFVVTAAYRTETYQTHLKEIFQAKKLLDKITDPEQLYLCIEHKSRVDTEFKKHGIKSTLVADGANGPHVRGTAFDISLIETIDRLRTKLGSPYALPIEIPRLIEDCGLIYPNPANDPVHFELKR